MNKDQVKVVLEDGAGKGQVATGKVMVSTQQQIKGIKKKVGVKTQKAVGNIKEVVKAGRK